MRLESSAFHVLVVERGEIEVHGSSAVRDGEVAASTSASSKLLGRTKSPHLGLLSKCCTTSALPSLLRVGSSSVRTAGTTTELVDVGQKTAKRFCTFVLLELLPPALLVRDVSLTRMLGSLASSS